MHERRRRFVEAYMGAAKGNATEAARIAGYRSPRAEGSRLLTNADVREAITARVDVDPIVKDREGLQRWWTRVVDDAHADLNVRLRASELLAKSQGLFLPAVAVRDDRTDRADRVRNMSDAELDAELAAAGYVRIGSNVPCA